MIVELINFRQYHDLTFTFEPNMLTLIMGRSGIGKSTIFEAIRWCITGKLQRISPHDLPKSKTSVRVTFPDGTVYYRLNSPKRFEVTNSAGHKLDELELNELYWNATTYLRQLDFHPLLEASESDKLELITALAIRKNDPTSRIDGVKSNIASFTAKLTKQQAVVANLKRQLAKELSVNRLSDQDLEYRPMITIQGEDIDDPTIITEKIEAFEARKTQLHKQLVEYQLNKKRRNELLKGITKTKEELETEINQLSNEIDLHHQQRELINIKRERDQLENRLKGLKRNYIEPTRPLPDKEWNNDEIMEAKELINKYTLNANIAKKYKIAYDQTIIENRIANLKVEIDELTDKDNTQRQIGFLKDQYDEYQRVKREYQLQQNLLIVPTDKLNGLVEVLSPEEDIKVIETQLALIDTHRNDEYYEAEKELQQSILTCPHCAGHLKYQRNTLIKIDHYDPTNARLIIDQINLERLTKLETLNKEYKALLVQRKEFNTYKSLKKKYEQEIYRIKTTLASLDKTLLTYKSIPELPSITIEDNIDYSVKIKILSAELVSLANIKFYSLPIVNPDQMSQDNLLIGVYHRKEEIDELTRRINELIIPDQLISLSYPTINETKAAINLLTDQLRRLDEGSSITLGNNPIKSYEQINKAITQLRTSLDEMNVINRLIDQQSDINQLDEEISFLSDAIETGSNLLSKMEEAKYASLIVIVNKLNKKVNNYLRRLFIDPIIFRLDMFRENKTGKKDIKPKVNVNINYKNHDVDLKSLSAGEYSRVSLSILLALAKINKSPLIMMDESLSTLEKDDLQRTIGVIKHYNRKHLRTILYIGHHETTGWYDRLITLDSLLEPVLSSAL